MDHADGIFSRIQWSADGNGGGRGWKLCSVPPWKITGSGYVSDGSCSSSLNYYTPGDATFTAYASEVQHGWRLRPRYGHHERYIVSIAADVVLKVEGFHTELDHDTLIWDQDMYSGMNVPPSGRYTNIFWCTDGGVSGLPGRTG